MEWISGRHENVKLHGGKGCCYHKTAQAEAVSVMPQTVAPQAPKHRSRFLILAAVLLPVVGCAALFFAVCQQSETTEQHTIRIGADGSERGSWKTDDQKESLLSLSQVARRPPLPALKQQSPEMLGLDQVIKELSLIPSMAPGAQTDEKEITLMLRWASFDPAQACNHAYQAVLGGADNRLLTETVSVWARVDPNSASRWASRLQSPLLRDIAVRTVYAIWNARNHTAAMGSLKFLPGSASRSSALSGIISSSDRDSKVALALAEKLPGPLRERTLQQLFGSWLQRDPQAAAEWLAGRPEEIQMPLAGRLAAEWVRKDPQAALFWTRAAANGPLTGPRLDPGPVQRRAMDAALGSYVGSDPEAAASWMTTGSGRAYFTERAASIASSWTSIDPISAAAWAASIPPGRDRDAAVGAISSTWTRSDPSEALRWIQEIQKVSDRNTALSSFGSMLAGRDPEAAAYWSSQISDGVLRDATLSRVVSQWRSINPGAAEQFVQTAPAAAFLRKTP
jgi:hypothetical protein